MPSVHSSFVSALVLAFLGGNHLTRLMQLPTECIVMLAFLCVMALTLACEPHAHKRTYCSCYSTNPSFRPFLPPNAPGDLPKPPAPSPINGPPAPAPAVSKKCGLLSMSICRPFTLCGFLGRLLLGSAKC
jgi:hypothetical protein